MDHTALPAVTLSWPGWLTDSGRFTHISGHSSAGGRAQDRESSPVKDQRSTTVPRNQSGRAGRASAVQIPYRAWLGFTVSVVCVAAEGLLVVTQ